MRLFGSDRISNIMSKLGLEEGQELEHRWLNRSIETAQRRVEQQHFSVRKRTLEYDDVMNKQREIIYGLRERVVCAEKVRDVIYDIMEDVIVGTVDVMLATKEEQAQKDFRNWVQTTFPVPLTAEEVKQKADDRDALASFVFERARKAYEIKVSTEEEHTIETMERVIVLQALDSHWQEYLRAMDGLRQGVGLRAYGQRDPLVEYKNEAYQMFQQLMSDIKTEVINGAFKSASSVERYGEFLRALPVQAVHETPPPATGGGQESGRRPPSQPLPLPPVGSGQGEIPGVAGERKRVAHPPAGGDRVGRNDPCPCGSGKKYKKCCGS
jgi:preprotein translocase subunit SecA